MAIIGWVDTETIGPGTEEWQDAPEDEAVLASYLTSAHEQCLVYLPHVDGEPVIPDPVPAGFRLAQIMQARALWSSAIAGAGDQLGPDGLSVTVYPMDWTVKNLLRPRRVGRVL